MKTMTDQEYALIAVIAHFVDGQPAHPLAISHAVQLLRESGDWSTIGVAFLTRAARVNLSRLEARREELTKQIADLRPRDVH